MTALDGMTTEEIAREVEHGKPWRNCLCVLSSIGRKGAFTCFVFQYLLYLGADGLWIVTIVFCVLLMELKTNRFTMQTYSTSEVVDLVMKRTTVEGAEEGLKPLGRAGGIAAAFAAFACALAQFDAPTYLFHVFVFPGLALVLFAVKTSDTVRNTKGAGLRFRESSAGGYTIEVPECLGEMYFEGFRRRIPRRDWLARFSQIFRTIILFPCLVIVLLFPFFVNVTGGMDLTDSSSLHLLVAVSMSIGFPVFACATHELWRFHLVNDEIEQLKSRLEKKGK